MDECDSMNCVIYVMYKEDLNIEIKWIMWVNSNSWCFDLEYIILVKSIITEYTLYSLCLI